MLLEPVPIVSVFCDGATWQGEPERGFWCYQKPDNPGPKGKPVLLFQWFLHKLILQPPAMIYNEKFYFAL